MALTQKKYLDSNGLTYLARKLNQYPTNDILISVIDGIQDALDEKVDSSSAGVSNGIAQLDSNGLVPISQLPDDISDVFSYSSYAQFPLSGETNKLYLDLATHKIYCWNGSQYAIVGGEIMEAITDSEIDALFT